MEPTVINAALASALASQYPSMLSLDLRGNNIVSIQDLRPLSRLHDLALDDNRLRTLDGLADLQLLTSLTARSNLISDLGERITALSSLRVLDLAWNRLAAGPWVHQLSRLPHLVELDLRGNPLCDLQGSMQLLAAAMPGLHRLNGAWLRPDAAAVESPLHKAPARPLPLRRDGTGGGTSEGAGAGAGLASAAAAHAYADAGQQPQLLVQQWHSQHPDHQREGEEEEAPREQLTITAGPPPHAGASRGSDPGVPAPAMGGGSTSGQSARSLHYRQQRQPRPQAPAFGPWLHPQSLSPSPSPPPPAGQQPGEVLSSSSAAAAAVVAAAVAEVAALRSQLEGAARAHGVLAEAHGGLLGEHQRLAQRAEALEEALRRAEDSNAGLQQQTAASAQQVAGLAAQMAALAAERDSVVAQSEALAGRLAEAEGRVAEANAAAAAAAQRAAEAAAAQPQLQRELAATHELLLRAQAQAAAINAQGAREASAAGFGKPHSPEAASRREHGDGGGGSGSGSSRVEAALQQRVEALHQVVGMQERELVRLGELAIGHPADASQAQEGGAASGGWDAVLRPWREAVTELQERLGAAAAEGEQRRAEWGQQLGEMREQFSQARTLLEVLEQRAREQRSENSQLHARVAQLVSELQGERQRAAGLERQLAARDAAAQAVRRQLSAFSAHMEQREAALEGRAEQLSAQAARLHFAGRRLDFALSLAATVRRGGGRRSSGAEGVEEVRRGGLPLPSAALGSGDDGGGAWAPAVAGALPRGRSGTVAAGYSHVALQGLLAASPAAKRVAAEERLALSPDSGLGPGSPPGGGEAAGGGGGGGDLPGHGHGGKMGNGRHASGAAQRVDEAAAPSRTVVAVLRREVEALVRDREVLLRQLAMVSSSAEERIRRAQTDVRERAARQGEALLAGRLRAATQAVEAEAERKVAAVEAATAAQSARVRQQVVAAVEAAEEACRRTEAAAGLRLSRLAVRLHDLEQQVGRLRGARAAAAERLAAAGCELEGLRREVAEVRAAEDHLRTQMAAREREAHARVAELRAEAEEALTAERRRAAEAERLASKAAAECGQLERQLARQREVRAQQEDARLRRLQSQLHEQEAQLRSLRRERNTLLVELRKHQGQQQEHGHGHVFKHEQPRRQQQQHQQQGRAGMVAGLSGGARGPAGRRTDTERADTDIDTDRGPGPRGRKGEQEQEQEGQRDEDEGQTALQPSAAVALRPGPSGHVEPGAAVAAGGWVWLPPPPPPAQQHKQPQLRGTAPRGAVPAARDAGVAPDAAAFITSSDPMGSSIRDILRRGGAHGGRAVGAARGSERSAAGLWGDGAGPMPAAGARAAAVSGGREFSAGVVADAAAAEYEQDEGAGLTLLASVDGGGGGGGGGTVALQRLSALEALTAELLAVD